MLGCWQNYCWVSTPARQWKWRTLYYSVRRIGSTGSVERLPGSGHHRSVRTDYNIELVSDLILRQEGQPGQVKVHGRSRERLEFHILQLWELPRMICSSKSFDAVKFSPWQQQINWNDWLHASVWRNVWLRVRSVVLGSWMKRFFYRGNAFWQPKRSHMPMWKQNVMCHQVDCFVFK